MPWWQDPDDEEMWCSGLEPWPNLGIEVTETENPVVAVLFGTDGDEILVEVFERRTIPFGFQKGEEWSAQ